MNGNNKWIYPGKCNLEALSPAILRTPGINFAVKWKLKIAESQNRLRKHFMISQLRDEPLFMAETVAVLSEYTTIFLFCHFLAHQ